MNEEMTWEWKLKQMKESGGWSQYSDDEKAWVWHFLEKGAEYSGGTYPSKRKCEEEGIWFWSNNFLKGRQNRKINGYN
jgi:hypothetical protein